VCALRALSSNGFTCHNIDSIKITCSFRTSPYILKESTFEIGKVKKKMKITVFYDENPRSLVDCEDVPFILL
jgi:hypothetical protein